LAEGVKRTYNDTRERKNKGKKSSKKKQDSDESFEGGEKSMEE
jgi:hypothetical protein